MNICSRCIAKDICEINSFIKNKSDIAVINIESCQVNESLHESKGAGEIKETNPAKEHRTAYVPNVSMSEIMVEEEGDEPSSDNIVSLISDRKIEKPDSNIIAPKDEFMKAHPDMVQCDICRTIVPVQKAKTINGKTFCDNCWESNKLK